MNYAKDQKKVLSNIYEETFKNKSELEFIFKDDPKINTSFYGEPLINESYKILKEKFSTFDEDLYTIQKHKYRFQISSLVLFIIISLIGISGYWLRREYIPWIASLLLLILSAPVFAMAGLETTYTFLSIDFCSSIGNSVISGIIPSENKGIGTYFSCPSKEAMRTISTAMYQYIVNYDYLYNETGYWLSKKKWLKHLSLGTDKRDNEYFDKLYIDVEKSEKPTHIDEQEEDDDYAKELIKRNLKSFKYFNNILAGLLSMTSCFSSKNSINYIEEKYCYKNHAYMFKNVIFDTISAIGFIIISIGLNKLIITMRSHFKRALRGKKEFNTDIMDEDDED
jgi:hypothetical protein